MHVEPGQDLIDLCQSWHLDNDKPLYVNTVSMDATPGWHHSDWVFVPEQYIDVADGTWSCTEENFEIVPAAIAGGVLFAQSTQAIAEQQQFPAGAAVVVPPRSVVVGVNHAFNVTSAPIDASIELTLELIDEAEVEHPLMPLAFDFRALTIPPHQTSTFVSECDLEMAIGAPPDFDIYWFLPHYHSRGRRLWVERFGGERDGELLFEGTGELGEPWGQMLDPPISLTGARGYRVGCEFQNPDDQEVGWGFGDGEMCIFLAFTDSPFKLAAGVFEWPEQSEPGSGEFTGPCLSTAWLR